MLEDAGAYASKCGYCKTGESCARGCWAHVLDCGTYERLMARGWRRSGKWLYQPKNERSCCPTLAIRLEAKRFEYRKEFRRVHAAMRRYVGADDAKPVEQAKNGKAPPVATKHDAAASDVLADAVRRAAAADDLPCALPLGELAACGEAHRAAARDLKHFPWATHATRAAFAIAAAAPDRVGGVCEVAHSVALALAKHLKASGATRAEASNGHVAFALERDADAAEAEVDDKPSKRPRCKPDAEAVRARTLSIAWHRSTADEESYALYQKYQRIVHGDEDDEDDDDDEEEEEEEEEKEKEERGEGEKDDDAGPLSDPSSSTVVPPRKKPRKLGETTYARFLVDTPLVPVDGTLALRVPSPRSAPPPASVSNAALAWADASLEEPPADALGSFHVQYRIDGRLVAVSVVDVLPTGVSSKYAFYDPDMGRRLQLGKFTSLYELDFVRRRALALPQALAQYYYLGFYLPTVPKMRYKATYRPSELLCPKTCTWRMLKHDEAPTPDAPTDDQATRDLERLMGSPAPAPVPKLEDSRAADDVLNQPLLVMGSLVPLGRVTAEAHNLPPRATSILLGRVAAWREAVGPACAEEIVYLV